MSIADNRKLWNDLSSILSSCTNCKDGSSFIVACPFIRKGFIIIINPEMLLTSNSYFWLIIHTTPPRTVCNVKSFQILRQFQWTHSSSGLSAWQFSSGPPTMNCSLKQFIALCISSALERNNVKFGRQLLNLCIAMVQWSVFLTIIRQSFVSNSQLNYFIHLLHTQTFSCLLCRSFSSKTTSC